jgi:hypothetical protein
MPRVVLADMDFDENFVRLHQQAIIPLDEF